MTALVASIVTAVITFALTATGTYLTTRRNLQVEYDSDLRKHRIESYRVLWAHLEDLAKYARRDTLTSAQVDALSERLRKWYFETGGIFLSTETRGDYFGLQDALEALVRAEGWTRLTEAQDEYLRVMASSLRTGMTRDVGTRKTFMFRSDAEPPGPARTRAFTERDGERELTLSVRSRRGLGAGRWRRAAVAEITIRDGAQVSSGTGAWDSGRRAVTTKVGDGPKRRFVLEGDGLVEGPSGWHRPEPAPTAEAVIWAPADRPREVPARPPPAGPGSRAPPTAR